MSCGHSTSSNGASLCPQGRGHNERIETELVPPFRFVAVAVDLAVVGTAKRHRELVAHLAPECPWLGESKMMGVGRLPPTHETSFGGDKLEMCLIAVTPGLP